MNIDITMDVRCHPQKYNHPLGCRRRTTPCRGWFWRTISSEPPPEGVALGSGGGCNHPFRIDAELHLHGQVVEFPCKWITNIAYVIAENVLEKIDIG